LDGNDACGDMEIDCGQGASCTVNCEGADGPCTGVDLNCDDGACTATCTDTDPAPSVDCGDSCECTECA